MPMPPPTDRDNDETRPPESRSGPKDGLMREDEPIPQASEDRVLEETARLAREGQRELENDPKEQGTDRDERDTFRE